MENKTISTSFQSKDEDFNKEMKLTQNTAYQPVVKTDTSIEEAMYSDLHDYSGIYHTSNLLLKLMHDIFIRLSATNT